MKLLVLAVGQRQPAWADAAWADFAKRFPPEMRLELKALKAEPRGARTRGAAAWPPRRSASKPRCPRARAASCSTSAATRLHHAAAGRAAARLAAARAATWRCLIGGPDGLDAALKASADETLRLSDLTLPHAFVRVLLAEALYRAWSLTAGHPYHRE